MDYDLDSKDDFLNTDDGFFETSTEAQYYGTDPEDMEEFGQVHLAKLKSLREQFNWENEEGRYPFYLRLTELLRRWRGNLPNLRDFFRGEEIDYFLLEAVKKKRISFRTCRGTFFIRFVIRTGYRDRPELNEDGKPSLRRTTALHFVAKQKEGNYDLSYWLFQIYHSYDVNYIDESGFTHFHVACRQSNLHVVKEFLELGQDPNCIVPETGDSPLHLALAIIDYDRCYLLFVGDTKKTIELLIRYGADPNLPNKEGLTPLHVICKKCEDVQLIKTFFEIIDANHLTIQIDAKDKLGRTPLQLAVANLYTDDLSSFVFPTENYFGDQRWELHERRNLLNLYLLLVVGALTVAELLEKRGYELDRSDALTIMKYFDKYEFFKKPVDLDKCLRRGKKFVKLAKECSFNPNLSFYDLLQLPPEEVKKIFTYTKCLNFHSYNYEHFWHYKRRSRECATHLSEMIARPFFRRWALEPLLELTRHYQLPPLCCDIIIKKLKNRDLMNICFAVAHQGEDLKKKTKTWVSLFYKFFQIALKTIRKLIA